MLFMSDNCRFHQGQFVICDLCKITAQFILTKLHCKGDFVVGDIKVQTSPLQNSNVVITLSVGQCVMVKLELCNGDLCSFTVLV